MWPYEVKSKTAIITVKGPHSPVAEFTENPQAPHPHEAVCFDASASLPGFDGDDECPISEYNWDFGDGYSGTGKTITHVYGESGNYTVTLTVTAPGIQPYIDAQYVSANTISTVIQVKQVLPVGGYSTQTRGFEIAQPLANYVATAIVLAVTTVVIRRKNQRNKRRQ